MSSLLRQARTDGTPGAHPWAVLAGHYTFDPNRADVEFLGRLAKIVARAGAPFLAGASPHVVGCDSFGASPPIRPRSRPRPDAANPHLRSTPISPSWFRAQNWMPTAGMSC